MTKKFLGKMVAGVALGGASLLIGAPGIALASDGPAKEVDTIFTKPEWAKPGHKVKIIEVCSEAVEDPWAWSEVTGKVALKLKTEHDKPGNDKPGNDKWDEDEARGEGESAEKGGWGGSLDDPKKDEDRKKDEHLKKEDAAADAGKKDKHAKDEKFVYYAEVKIPWKGSEPGHYKLVGQCAEGELKIAPKGWVHGGDGGASGTNTGLAASGAGMLGAAALGGIVLMRRRTNGSLA